MIEPSRNLSLAANLLASTTSVSRVLFIASAGEFNAIYATVFFKSSGVILMDPS